MGFYLSQYSAAPPLLVSGQAYGASVISNVPSIHRKNCVMRGEEILCMITYPYYP